MMPYSRSRDRNALRDLEGKTSSEVVLDNGWANSGEPKLKLKLRNGSRGRNLNGGVIPGHSLDRSEKVRLTHVSIRLVINTYEYSQVLGSTCKYLFNLDLVQVPALLQVLDL